ncbi:LytR/AlgR family response regulator transcription factor [Paenibacillus sp. Leaf72]|uniref:LytR/AlgR family response regulator transcription factor n=1 Tax=Paenibacillus sp. Leaf72 TaxID=1736234 RepID=UPI0006FDC411|nr:response regulator [Paenibacillus sp. Leaf72]KQN96985.1 hypothetical protein ASF12_23235 [Paenibacillus sp. Leaf72]
MRKLTGDKLNVLIAEDDMQQQQVILSQLERLGNINVKGIASNSQELINLATEWKDELDALILDVELGGGRTGLDTYARFTFRGIKIPAILVTGSKPEGADTYDLGIIDVVEKPYTIDRLQAAINKLSTHVNYEKFVLNGGFMIPVIDNNNIKQLYPSEVCCIETKKEIKHSIVWTAEDDFITLVPLKVYENYLDRQDFYRVSRSILVHLNRIKNVMHNQILFFDRSDTLEIPDDRIQDFMTAWKRFNDDKS